MSNTRKRFFHFDLSDRILISFIFSIKRISFFDNEESVDIDIEEVHYHCKKFKFINHVDPRCSVRLLHLAIGIGYERICVA
jgi:hypothetical protein